MKKYLFFLVFLILLTGFTLYYFINENTLIALSQLLKNVNVFYILVLLVIVWLYFLLQGLYMKIILESLGKKITTFKGIFYSMVEFYFSGITPSSTGGQPVQLYYMSKDKIPTTSSTITLILNTMFFKIILIILGLLVLIFNNKYIFNHSTFYTVFFFLGLSFDILLTVFCTSLIFSKKIISKILKRMLKFFSKLPLIGNWVKKFDIDEVIDNYHRQANYIKKHKRRVFYTFILTFFQRLLMFSVAYFVYRGLGCSDISYLELLSIQISVQVTLEMLPIPGGAVMAETMLRDAFSSMFGIAVAEVGMLFTRTFTFYIPIFLCGIIIVIYTIKERKKYID